MKKLFAMLLALVLAMMTLSVWAEEGETELPVEGELITAYDLSGYVMDVTDETILLKTPDGLYVEAKLTDETTAEGTAAAIGDYIHVIYNGMMTRSLPAQITAEHVRSSKLTGVVADMTENGFTIVTDSDEYLVNAEADKLTGIQTGMTATVYFNGAMTMSLPAQVSAEHIRGEVITGTVTEMTSEGFLVSVEGVETPYTVIPREDALLFVQPEPGMTVGIVTDGVMAPALDAAIVNALEVLPVEDGQELFDMAGVILEITDEYVIIETAEGQRIQVNVSPETLYEGKEIAVGDLIHVTYNGQMTFSIPAQIAALKIGCYTHTGTVLDVGETYFLLQTELEPIIVNIRDGMAEYISMDAALTVYTNGTMTMSLPAQVAAELIIPVPVQE